MLRVNNVNKFYSNGEEKNHVLKDVSLNIGRGEFISICGKSGSGKSTLLNVLSTLMKPDGGELYYNDTGYHHMKERDLNRLRNNCYSMIFQFHYLIPYLNALENVLLPFTNRLFPVHKKNVEYAKECLDKVDLQGKYERLPGQLSGGEQQRVAVARALVKKPEILFADEPTGSLDDENSREIARIFTDLHAEGYTIVMVTHDITMAGYAEKILNMKDGKIVS